MLTQMSQSGITLAYKHLPATVITLQQQIHTDVAGSYSSGGKSRSIAGTILESRVFGVELVCTSNC